MRRLLDHPLVALAAVVILPLAPASLLLELLHSTASISGPLEGLRVDLGGAFAAYVVVLVFAGQIALRLRQPVADPSEPVQPPMAAKCFAMTYFHQYARRAVDAARAGQVVVANGQHVKPKGLVVVLPENPGSATHFAAEEFYKSARLEDAYIGPDRRTAKFSTETGWLYDIPSILNTFSALYDRDDVNLVSAVPEFGKALEGLANSPRFDTKGAVRVTSKHDAFLEISGRLAERFR